MYPTQDEMKRCLQQHFDQLAQQCADVPEIKPLHQEVALLLQKYKAHLHPQDAAFFLAWEERQEHLHALEKEWLFLQGVKYGARLMMSNQLSTHTNQ